MNLFALRFGKSIAAATVVAIPLVYADPSDAQESRHGSSDKTPGKLSAERRNLLQTKLLPMAKQIAKIAFEEYRSGKGDVQMLCRWSKRIMEAEYQLAETRAKKTAAVKEHRDLLNSFLQTAKAMFRVGKTKQTDVLILQYHLAQAEFKLKQENEK